MYFDNEYWNIAPKNSNFYGMEGAFSTHIISMLLFSSSFLWTASIPSLTYNMTPPPWLAYVCKREFGTLLMKHHHAQYPSTMSHLLQLNQSQNHKQVFRKYHPGSFLYYSGKIGESFLDISLIIEKRGSFQYFLWKWEVFSIFANLKKGVYRGEPTHTPFQWECSPGLY